MNSVKAGIVDAQIVQRNELWGELAIKRLYDLINNENISSSENTSMYELIKKCQNFSKYRK